MRVDCSSVCFDDPTPWGLGNRQFERELVLVNLIRLEGVEPDEANRMCDDSTPEELHDLAERLLASDAG